MSYKEEFKIYCSTIAGEAGGSSDEAIKTVARSIITRTGFREWKTYATAFEVIKHSGYDAYTDRSSSPNYKVVYKAMSSGRLDDLSRKIIKLVEPIYKRELPDETGMLSLYYSPKAQKALHEKNPKKYKEKPPWNFSVLERVYIAGTSEDDFNWYRYKGDGSTVKTLLLNSVNSPVSGEKITIKVTDRLGNYFVKEYTTNNKGEIPDIHARKKSMIEFFVGETLCKSRIAADGIPKKVVLKDYECKFETQTVPHKTIPTPSIENVQTQETQNSSQKINEHNDSVNNSLEEVTFNIKLVEGDTGKPLPNTTYYLEYKNNIKPHKTDSSGVESGIKADVSQSISVYLDDDGGKKQSIYSMAFPVTGDLNGQTKVLKVPVVTLQLKFMDKNKEPIPNYAFKTVYRGRTSETKKTNSTGIVTVKALAGQPIKIIHQTANKTSTNIVTDGSTEWTFDTSKLIKDSGSSASPASNASSNNPSSAQKPNDTKPNTSSPVDKGNVIRNDKITQKGPTHEVKTDQAKITIKFLDEATDKPLSGLTYWTQSTKYGKNPATTGSDGTRGRTHDSDVGINIAVLVNENGKEVKKGTIVANSDKNGVAYVYKAKKPKHSNIKISFSRNTKSTVVTEKTKTILREIAEKYGAKELIITSSLRTPEEQASAMYDNIAGGKRISYRTPGEIVTQVCEKGIKMKLGREKTIQNMVSKILEYDKKGQRVSKHCVSFETYAKANIIDLGINSNGFNTYTKKERFQRICDEAERQGKISGFISPLRDKAESAFHLEIPQ
ncbi:hypothetical protein AAJP47_10075 [Psychrobacter sp. B38]|uniref:hypothetical protein n=1 Tax=Psychrobacter sp. B38 TaxID=3143538 RepID=UPI00320D9A62